LAAGDPTNTEWQRDLSVSHEKSAIGSVRRSGGTVGISSPAPSDLISGFMKRIGLADHVIVVLSDKYLRSPYCMTELYSIYRRTVGEKEDFLRGRRPVLGFALPYAGSPMHLAVSCSTLFC
jgi:hypothetical protein